MAKSRSLMVFSIVLISAVATAEIFLEFSHLPLVKLLCFASAAGLLIVIAGPAHEILGRRGRLALLLTLMVYMLVAAGRFPGLLKEPETTLISYGGLIARVAVVAVLAFALARGSILLLSRLRWVVAEDEHSNRQTHSRN